MTHPSVGWPSSTAGIDPASITPLLWAWLRAPGSDPHPTVVTASTAVSERRIRRGPMRM